MKILIKGHSYKHDLFELIRIFFPEKELIFIEERTGNEEFLIESIFMEDVGTNWAITRVYIEEKLIKEVKQDILDIKIPNYEMDQLIKIAIKKSVFDALVDISEVYTPWGTLTGIRPLKIVHRLLDNQIIEEDILNILTKEYRIHESKAKLMLNISNVQRKHIYPLDRDRYSIYMGIPFCPTRCSYCSFPAFRIGKAYDLVERYVDTLLYEISKVKELMEGKTLNTIYIGGGTPTAIKVGDLERIVKSLRYNFPQDVKEFTVEAGRPDTIDKEMLNMLKSYGINRISINPQTMNDKTLKLIGRNHDMKSIISSYELAKATGFDIINMDIILGLPEEGTKEIKFTLNEIKKLDPENLTVHTLALKRGSKLFKEEGDYILKQKTNVEKMIYEVESFAEEVGLIPYYLYRQKQILGNLENVGYSKKGMESIYNIIMMEEKETVIGLGLGAVSKIYEPKTDRIQRIPNFKDLNEYSNRIDELIYKKQQMITDLWDL